MLVRVFDVPDVWLDLPPGIYLGNEGEQDIGLPEVMPRAGANALMAFSDTNGKERLPQRLQLLHPVHSNLLQNHQTQRWGRLQ